jgi:hypothetical protein
MKIIKEKWNNRTYPKYTCPFECTGKNITKYHPINKYQKPPRKGFCY